MKISKDELVRQVLYRILIVFIPTLLVVIATIFCLNTFVYKPNIYTPAVAEIFDISLVFTLLFLRVKISQISWKPILSEILLSALTSGLIYAIWHSVLGWRYASFSQDIKIEDILIMKIIYLIFIYFYDFLKKIFPKQKDEEFEPPLPL